MTRKVILLVLSYFILGVIGFTACVSRYEATICDVQFTGLYTIGIPDHEEPDTFDDQIGFDIRSIESSPTCYLPSLQIFNSAHATSKCAEFQNRILTSTYEISFDRPFVLDNDTIHTNTDLLSISDIVSLTEITIDESCNFVDSRIIFKTELIDRIEFETGEYEVTFRCSTSDSRAFTKTRRVIFQE